MSSERFLAEVMGLSRRRSSGLLLRSLTFCLSRERSFRLGSEAEGPEPHVRVPHIRLRLLPPSEGWESSPSCGLGAYGRTLPLCANCYDRAKF